MQPEREVIFIKNTIFHPEEEIIDLTIDVAFKKMFTDENNLWFLAYIISYIVELDYDYVLKHIKFKHPFRGSSQVEARTGEADILVGVEDTWIDIEMQRKVDEESIKKNNWFLRNTSVVSKQSGERFKGDNRIYIQIILSGEPRFKNKPKLIYKIIPMEESLGVEDIYNNIVTYDFNLAYLKQEYYTKNGMNKEEKRFLIFIEKNKEKLRNLYEGDQPMEELVNHAEKLYQDTGFRVVYDHALHEKYVHENELEDAIEETRKETREETEKQTKLEIAKNFLALNVNTIEQIAEATKLPIEEIEKLKHAEK